MGVLGIQDRQGRQFHLAKFVPAEVDFSSAACGGAEATATPAGTNYVPVGSSIILLPIGAIRSVECRLHGHGSRNKNEE